MMVSTIGGSAILSTVISITTGISDLVGDLSAVFDERPAVEDCTTMPEHRERKKYE